MKSNIFSKYFVNIVEHIYSRYDKKQLEEKNILLAQADISLDIIRYSSIALMNMVFGFISMFILSLVIFTLAPSFTTLIFLILAPLTILITIGFGYWYLPIYRVKRREKNIDLYLPYAINFISSMAIAGISPSEIFQSLSTINVYGEIQKEAKKIAKEISIMGTDSITALKNAIEISPSNKFRSFLQGIIGTIQSGSDLHDYLSNVAEKYMQEDLSDRKKDLDLLGVIAEVLVLAVIAFPILLVIILTIVGFFGGSMEDSFTLLLIFSFLILPVVYAMFYLLIRSTSFEKLGTLSKEKGLKVKEFYLKNKTTFNILFISCFFITLLYIITILFVHIFNFEFDLFLFWDFVFLSFLIIIGPIGFYNYIDMKKKKEMQKRLPEFLNEVGNSLSTGMNIFEAVKSAEKGHYGQLHPEIKKMKTQLSWNVSIKDVFFDFAGRMKSAIVNRIVIAINKALIMGGETPKIFKAAADEVSQINQIEHQRKSIMS
ncbi:MAG: type II secretion system F family protein, partial [Thermoplasmatales archaeon]